MSNRMVVRFELERVAGSSNDANVYPLLENTPMGYSGCGINVGKITGNYLVGNGDCYRDVLSPDGKRLSYDGEGKTGDQSRDNANNAKLISHLDNGGTITYIKKEENGYRVVGEFRGA